MTEGRDDDLRIFLSSSFVPRMILGKPSLLVFDLDGTLVDTVPDIALAANFALKKHGFQAKSPEEVKRAVGEGVHELLARLTAPKEAGREVLESMVLAFKRYYSEHPVESSRPFPHVVDMLKGPLAAAQKAVVTNKPHDLTEEILKRLGLSAFFKACVGMENNFPPKPDPAALWFVCDQLKVVPSATLLIGDSSVDWMTSLRAGVPFVWMAYGYEDLTSEPGLRVLRSAEEWAGLV